MKIGLLDVFKVINEIYTVRKMSIAERVLLRPKKDLINYVAIHLWSIIKAILVFGILLALIERPECVPIKVIYVFIILGSVIILCDPIGFKAIISLIKKLLIMLFKVHKKLYYESINNFKKMSATFKDEKLIVKILLCWPFCIIVLILLMPLSYVLNMIILLGIYSIAFSFLIFLNNETLVLIISYTLCKKLMPMITIDFIIYILYILLAFLIYYCIDIRVRLTSGNLVLEQSIDDGVNMVIGMQVQSIRDNLSLYQKDNLSYVLNNTYNSLKIYSVKSKLDDMKADIENRIIKRREKKLLESEIQNNKDDVEKTD
jgi:hypothetical protein